MKKTPIQRLYFNMVEVVVALVIIMVALIGIMGMIPHGIEASYDARARASAADVADQFLHYMSTRIETSWDETTAFPDAKSEEKSSSFIFSTNDLLSESNLRIAFEAPNEVSDWDPTVSNKGIFRVTQMTDSNLTDFQGEVRVWKEIVGYSKDFTTPGTQVVRGTTPSANIPDPNTTVTPGALWSGSKLEVIGTAIQIPGGHSNGDVRIGVDVKSTGILSCTGSASTKGQTTTQVGTQPQPTMPRTLDEYKQLAQKAGTYYTKNVEVQINPTSGSPRAGELYLRGPNVWVKDGSVIFVDGATVTAKQTGLNFKATLICTGAAVDFRCNDFKATPAIDNLLIWCRPSATGGSIQINGNNMAVTGIIKTGGSIKFNGNNGSTLDGNLWAGGDVDISGNTLVINGDEGGIDVEPVIVVNFAGDNRSTRANASHLITEAVLSFCDGSTQTFTGLSTKTVPLWGTGDNDLKRVETVKVTLEDGSTETVTNTNVDCSKEDDLGKPGETFTGQSLICILNAEVSWPIDAPYEKRTKVLYRSEVAKPAEVFKKE